MLISPGWIKRAWLFFWEAFWAGVKAFAQKQAEIKADQDRGAAAQREAQQEEDLIKAKEASDVKKEIDVKSDADVRSELDRWVRPN